MGRTEMSRFFAGIVGLALCIGACSSTPGLAGSGSSDGVNAAIAFIPANDLDDLQLYIDDLGTARSASWWGEARDGIPYEFWTHQDHRFSMLASIDAFVGREAGLSRYGESFGYDVEDANIVVSSTVDGAPLHVAVGAIDRAAISEVIEADEEWSGELTTETAAGGSEYWQWGDDVRFDLGRSPGRPLARGGQLFTTDSLAVRTVMTERMEEALAARDSGRDVTVLDDMATVIQRLSDEQFLTAFITNTPVRPFGGLGLDPVSPEELEALTETLSDGLGPYRLLAVATTDGGDRPASVAILVHGTSDLAQNNARLIEATVADGESSATGEPWIDIVGNVTVEVDGTIVVARFDGDRPDALFESIVRGDGLFAVGSG